MRDEEAKRGVPRERDPKPTVAETLHTVRNARQENPEMRKSFGANWRSVESESGNGRKTSMSRESWGWQMAGGLDLDLDTYGLGSSQTLSQLEALLGVFERRR